MFGFGGTDVNSSPVGSFLRVCRFERLVLVMQHETPNARDGKKDGHVTHKLSRTTQATHDYVMSHKQTCDRRQPILHAVRHSFLRGVV